jgi:hypothetical protein
MSNRPHSQLDCYFDLKGLAAYSSMSERSLRDYLHDPRNPLPYFKPGGRGRVLVKRSDFDRWLSAWRYEGGKEREHIKAILARIRTPDATGQVGSRGRSGNHGAK